MEHLDSREGDQETCEYTIIGGRSCHLTRVPSTLMSRDTLSPPSSLSHRSCKVRRAGLMADSASSSIEEGAGSRSSSCLGNNGILRWDEEDIQAWLKEVGMENYEVRRARGGRDAAAWPLP